MDGKRDKTIRCIPLLPLHLELHTAPTAQVSAHNQVHAESGLRSLQIKIRRCTLNRMYRDGLNPPKLTKHPLRQISHHAVSVSQPSRVKADPVKRTCLTVVSIWGHDNPRQIQRIQMIFVVV